MFAPITQGHYLFISVALLLIGTVGVLTRRNIVIILMSIELILNGVNLNLVTFSAHYQHVTGQVFTIFVIAVAVAEAAVGL
jgi:NADH-quinone oxidoreductase subunit K